MTPNLYDKLLDALGMIPFGTALRMRRLRELWRRLSHLRDLVDRVDDQLKRSGDRVRRTRQNMRELAERRDTINRSLEDLHLQRKNAPSGFDQQRIDERARLTERELQRVHDQMAPAFDEITADERELSGLEVRRRQYDVLGKEIFIELEEFFLPMALMSCVAHSLGIDLMARAEFVEAGPYTIDGEYTRYDGSAYDRELILLCLAHRPVAWTSADSTGRFVFDNLAPGEYTVAAMHETLCMRRVTLEGVNRTVRLGPTECMPHLLVVQNDSGEPLEDVTAVLCGFSTDRIETIAIAEAYTRGTVCLPRRPDLNVAILVYRMTEDGITLLHTDIYEAKHKPYSKLRLESHSVRANVFDQHTSEPIPGVVMTALPLNGDLIAGAFARMAGFRATTDTSGMLQIHGAPPGKYMLTISAKGYDLHMTEVKIQEDHATHLGSFKLKRHKQSAGLIGYVRDPYGHPTSAYVSIVRPNSRPLGCRKFTDANGAFEFTGLAPGNVVIEVQGERPSELARRKMTLHGNKRTEVIITLKHALDFD